MIGEPLLPDRDPKPHVVLQRRLDDRRQLFGVASAGLVIWIIWTIATGAPT